MKKLLLLIALFPTFIQAEYKYTDSDGVVHTRREKKGLPTQPTEVEQLQAQIQQLQAVQEQQLNLQRFQYLMGTMTPIPQYQTEFGQSQQIENIKYNFNSRGVSTEQTIGNKTFTNGPR